MKRALLAILALTLGTLGPGHAGERFSFPAETLVEDSAKGLVWMRCSLGQRFHEGRCLGEAERLSLNDAEARLDTLATAACPWRLPRFFEMRSLLQADESRNVAIDSTAFPDTPSGWYWNQVSAGGHSQQDCFVDFGGQGRTRCNMAGQFHLRAVMDADASPGCRLSEGN
ncbi:DUF1566 domain-containing protein [Billgrantia sp. LNSP4103-1]|uniref:Lcl C-terminal domain-containing protein n=1 Tax=Billgrantia sp. LNSP4103-1 TaxID=3410266 RepID=UPI00403F9E1D